MLSAVDWNRLQAPSKWSQPARQVHDDKCEEGGDCMIAVYFHDKLDFKPVDTKAQ